ncbi:mannitol dehydrogenase family protein [Agrobacterium tumefaciens]|uniref:mannitol dehydrogenase family protein n=1 Tax=Agrobacterium tumefaciens TaxID=358 RepID=UPI0009B9DBED|nr:mannitol dehydrogenase family protein [Agrobacterium tumefaciens]AYM19937.1 hypothetical protein At15955_49520 [Agrobacterium tumefaciens]AYM71240.1 hypothetical protein AtA6_50240 [Agrobacterium tumefaciens]NIB58679.1 mannitol dehydrogenase family protein [Agrobacterium tumefaciens]NSZ25607.1 mannitol dehydrogenase family protein [Agrobacterium tumefaciens]NTB21696.1 mannitol dehydrogenase family protein [Agrobacterium tumefaciens]
MIKLRKQNMSRIAELATVPKYDRSAVTAGIVHIGVGNFHRVHQAPVIDDCLHKSNMQSWGIAGVGLQPGSSGAAKRDAYSQQDCLYSVTTLDGLKTSLPRVIGAMVEYHQAGADPQAVLSLMAAQRTRIVSLTITEGGYNIDEATGEFRSDSPEIVAELNGGVPTTAFGYICRAMKARRADGLNPFTVLSCDNLRSNGDTTRKAVVGYAHLLDPDLASWIDHNGAFPNSMVDRIAPNVSDEDRVFLNEINQFEDLLPATCEPYTKWVVEDRFCAGRPPMEEAGVEFRSDISAYEAVKGRLSNAAHMMMCFPSLLLGHRFVHEGMTDPLIPRLLRNFWDLDVLRLVEPPVGYSTADFTNGVIARFSNPLIKDRLLRVAGDGVSKINVFHSKTLKQLIEARADLTREVFLLASFARYLDGKDDRGEPYEVFEPRLTEEDRRLIAYGDTLGLLRTSMLRSFELETVEGFATQYSQMLHSLRTDGTAATLDRILV